MMARPGKPLRAHLLIFLLSALMMALMLAKHTALNIGELMRAELPNPDSYYRLVLARDQLPVGDLHFMPRDNAPYGSWLHWSEPHTRVIRTLSHALADTGLPAQDSLLLAGSAVTLISMLLLAGLTGLALYRCVSLRAAVLGMLALTTSLPLFGYGTVRQITHHIFMLVPVALAAACLLGRQRPDRWLDLLAGLALGLALWISPETMPAVLTWVVVRMMQRLQAPEIGHAGFLVAGLLALLLFAWRQDPPPPTFSPWALDHVSLAWLSFALLLALLMLLTDVLVTRRVALPGALGILVLTGVSLAGVWLCVVPGVLSGPAGLMPAELKPLFWSAIQELKPAQGAAEVLSIGLLPVIATALLGSLAWRRRSLWMAVLAMASLCYGILALLHVRLGPPASLMSSLALGVFAGTARALDDHEPSRRVRDQAAAIFLIVLAVLPVTSSLLVGRFSRPVADSPGAAATVAEDDPCRLSTVADSLQRLPPATILAPLSQGPELLFRTHHRVIAGPYHHNLEGMLDSYRAWLDGSGQTLAEVAGRRGITLVLGCTYFQVEMLRDQAAPSLAQRIAKGQAPVWLQPVPWPAGVETGWRLYRVRLPANSVPVGQ